MEVLKLSLLILFHPVDGFNHIKADRNKFSYWPVLILLFLVLACRVAYIYIMHYPLAFLQPRDANLWLEMVRMILPLVTWVLANYAVTTIMEGKTLIREVLMATAYSMLPYILLSIPLAVASHIMGLGELKLFTGLQNVMWLWVFILFFISTLTMNEFNFIKTIGICALSVVGIALVWIISGLFFALTSQVYHFVEEIILEIKMLYSM